MSQNTTESLLPTNSSSSSSSNSGNPIITISIGVIIFGICIMNASVGALCISDAENIKSTGQVFLALYMILFAGLVFFIELNYIVKIPGLNEFIEQNLGFAMTPLGMGWFLFFVGLMGFGLDLSQPKYLDILAAIVTCVFGVLLAILYCAMPSVFPKRAKNS